MGFARFARQCAAIALVACSHASSVPQGGVTSSSPAPTSKEDRIDFTRQLRDQRSLTPAEIKSLQFYLAKSITLQRELSSGERQVTPRQAGHEGRQVHRRSGRPRGHAWRGGRREPGRQHDRHQLRIRHEAQIHGPVYTLLADTWGGKDGAGKITFDGRVYDAINHSYLAHLSIDRQSLSKLETDRRVLKGVRVDTTGKPPASR